MMKNNSSERNARAIFIFVYLAAVLVHERRKILTSVDGICFLLISKRQFHSRVVSTLLANQIIWNNRVMTAES